MYIYMYMYIYIQFLCVCVYIYMCVHIPSKTEAKEACMTKDGESLFVEHDWDHDLNLGNGTMTSQEMMIGEVLGPTYQISKGEKGLTLKLK